MLKNCFIAMLATIAFLAGANVVLALDPIPSQSGFSGYVRPGVGYLNLKSNMVAKVLSFELSDDRITDLGDEPDEESTAIATIPYKLAYTFAGSRTQVFLGTEVGDLLSFDTAQQLGVKQGIGSLGVLQAGLLFSGIVKVWKDPYTTTESRDDTSRQNVGFQLVWDKVLGSGFELEYSGRQVEIGSERSGETLALTGAQRDRLDREGTLHRLSAAYGFKFGAKHELIPELRLNYDDLDGEAMANTGVDLLLTYIYSGDPITLALNGSIGEAEYDKSNPVFGKTRDDDRYGASATVYYKNPWGWTLFGSEPMQFFVSGSYYVTDSNIDFYNQEALLGLGGVAFRWK